METCFENVKFEAVSAHHVVVVISFVTLTIIDHNMHNDVDFKHIFIHFGTMNGPIFKENVKEKQILTMVNIYL